MVFAKPLFLLNPGCSTSPFDCSSSLTSSFFHLDCSSFLLPPPFLLLQSSTSRMSFFLGCSSSSPLTLSSSMAAPPFLHLLNAPLSCLLLLSSSLAAPAFFLLVPYFSCFPPALKCPLFLVPTLLFPPLLLSCSCTSLRPILSPSLCLHLVNALAALLLFPDYFYSPLS